MTFTKSELCHKELFNLKKKKQKKITVQMRNVKQWRYLHDIRKVTMYFSLSISQLYVLMWQIARQRVLFCQKKKKKYNSNKAISHSNDFALDGNKYPKIPLI